MKKRLAIIATVVVLIASGVVVAVSGSSSAAPARHCVKIGRLQFCYSSTIDQVTESVSSISALINTPGGPSPETVTGVQKIVFNTPSVAGGQTTCVNQNDGSFLCN